MVRFDTHRIVGRICWCPLKAFGNKYEFTACVCKMHVTIKYMYTYNRRYRVSVTSDNRHVLYKYGLS